MGSANVYDALVDLLHEVLVNVRVLIQLPEILHVSEALTLLLRYTKD
jgi:hypothetical protein